MRTTMIALALLLGLAAGGAGTALAQGALSWVSRDNQKVCSATISDTPISGSFFL